MGDNNISATANDIRGEKKGKRQRGEQVARIIKKMIYDGKSRNRDPYTRTLVCNNFAPHQQNFRESAPATLSN
jgi:hypothetical protein